MLWSAKSLHGYRILATDGEIGKTNDFFFDELTWLLSYLVVDTGHWLPGRQVLISPEAIQQPDWESQRFPVNLSKAHIENSPEIAKDMPISRQKQMELHTYYAWPYYWEMSRGLHPSSIPFTPVPPIPLDPKNDRDSEDEHTDSHLRSMNEVVGYHIQATDGAIGHVEDFILDDEYWLIRYLVIDTRNWLPGRKVLISPDWAQSISWERRSVALDMSKNAIENSPEYHPAEAVNRQYETRLYDYYGRPTYWNDK